MGRNSDELRLKHIAKFLRIFSAHSIPLILLEPSILKILPTFDPRTKCHYFCSTSLLTVGIPELSTQHEVELGRIDMHNNCRLVLFVENNRRAADTIFRDYVRTRRPALAHWSKYIPGPHNNTFVAPRRELPNPCGDILRTRWRRVVARRHLVG